MNNSLSIWAISSRQWKIFFISLAGTFLMTTLRYLVPHPVALVSPRLIQLKTLEIIRPRLERVENQFRLVSPPEILQSQTLNSYNDSKAYLVTDFNNGQIIYEKNLSQQIPIASLTKIMTAIVSLDLARKDEVFMISENAASQIPTSLQIPAGQKLTLEELLNGILLTSANDAAQTVKEGIDQKYGNEIFIEAMNEKAKIIGLKNTHFTNPQGFDNSQNFSSVEDLAILAHYALTNYPLIEQIVKKDYQFYPANENHKQIDLYNWNGLLDVYPGVIGMKIGNTDDAGYTTLVVSEREGKKLLAVLLGAPGVKERDLWTSELLDDSFKDSANLTPVKITEADLKKKYSTWKYFN